MSAATTPTAAPAFVWSFYAYSPSLVLPIVVAVLFAFTAFGHTWFMVKKRAWYMWPFTLACYGEVAGYAFRRISAAHPIGRNEGLVWFLCQSLFIILAPALMAASHYMIFGRLITYVGESFSPISARRVTLVFVIFDVLSFVVQGGGGSIYASDNPNLYNTAKAILLVGFLIQIISFGIFGVCAGLYQIRARRAGILPGKWTKCLYTLYAGCSLILLRGIFRTIEFGTGQKQHSYLLDHEVWYYVLEALPIFLCAVLFLVSHPSRYISSDRRVRMNQEFDLRGGEEDVELQGQGQGEDKKMSGEGDMEEVGRHELARV